MNIDSLNSASAQAVRDYILGPNVLTVGAKGRFTTIEAAFAYLAALPLTSRYTVLHQKTVDDYIPVERSQQITLNGTTDYVLPLVGLTRPTELDAEELYLLTNPTGLTDIMDGQFVPVRQTEDPKILWSPYEWNAVYPKSLCKANAAASAGATQLVTNGAYVDSTTIPDTEGGWWGDQTVAAGEYLPLNVTGYGKLMVMKLAATPVTNVGGKAALNFTTGFEEAVTINCRVGGVEPYITDWQIVSPIYYTVLLLDEVYDIAADLSHPPFTHVKSFNKSTIHVGQTTAYILVNPAGRNEIHDVIFSKRKYQAGTTDPFHGEPVFHTYGGVEMYNCEINARGGAIDSCIIAGYEEATIGTLALHHCNVDSNFDLIYVRGLMKLITVDTELTSTRTNLDNIGGGGAIFIFNTSAQNVRHKIFMHIVCNRCISESATGTQNEKGITIRGANPGVGPKTEFYGRISGNYWYGKSVNAEILSFEIGQGIIWEVEVEDNTNDWRLPSGAYAAFAKSNGVGTANPILIGKGNRNGNGSLPEIQRAGKFFTAAVKKWTTAGAVTFVDSWEQIELAIAGQVTATIADTARSSDTLFIKCTVAPTTNHTVTLASGTWNGTGTIATFTGLNSFLLVKFDSAGNGSVIASSGVVIT